MNKFIYNAKKSYYQRLFMTLAFAENSFMIFHLLTIFFLLKFDAVRMFLFQTMLFYLCNSIDVKWCKKAFYDVENLCSSSM